MFGLLMVPILTMTVFATDYSRALGSRTALQDAVDAAGLALAHLPSTTTQAQLDTAAKSWIGVNLKDRSIGPLTIVAKINPLDRTVQVSANATVATLSGGLTSMLSGGGPGILQIPVSAYTTVKWGTKIELALVLDNTYSMVMDGSTKLADLKTATTNLVNTLSTATASNPDDLKIGVVPFSVSVNVGPANQSAAWISGAQPALYGPNGAAGMDVFKEAGVDRFRMFSNISRTWGGCVESRPPPYDVQETAPAPATPGTMFVPYFSPDETGSYKVNGTTYTGYNDYMDESASDATLQGSSSKYNSTQKRTGASGWGTALGPSPYWDRGPNMGCSGIASILPLTTNMTTVRAKLTEMQATGTTHIPIGMVWGWHVLSPNAPFAIGAPYSDVAQGKVTKVAVLVTDGENTYFSGINGKYNSSYTGYGYSWQNRLGVNAFSTSAAATTVINDRLKLLCSNMKAANIVIYTVPVQVTDPTIKGLLKACATDPVNGYIEVTTTKGMTDAFASIAGSITKLRIAH